MGIEGLGLIVVLNGVPRSGKSSIAAAIQGGFDGAWMNLGADVFGCATPERFRPGIGLRPGGERPDVEALLPALYAALYGSIAAHSRLGLKLVADVGHHEGHGRRLGILPRCAALLSGLPALLVGVRCPIEAVMARRRTSGGGYLRGSEGEPVPAPVQAWQDLVHAHAVYDVEVDTADTSPEDCAAIIGRALREGVTRPTAFERLAAMTLHDQPDRGSRRRPAVIGEWSGLREARREGSEPRAELRPSIGGSPFSRPGTPRP